MNQVTIIGRTTRELELRYTQSGLAIAKFSVAINRPKGKDGQDNGADFPRVSSFGKTAELLDKFLYKGARVCIVGHLHTDSYQDKNGNTVYTTDVVADRVEFIDFRDNGNGNSSDNGQNQATSNNNEPIANSMPRGFEDIEDEDIPF